MKALHKSKTFPLNDLILAFSESLDLISNQLIGHHIQVAYIAVNIAVEMDIKDEEIKDLLQASLFHDVGGLTLLDRIDALAFDMEELDPHKHAEVGYCLMKIDKTFEKVAEIIRFHHVNWNERKLFNKIDININFLSHIVHLSDRASVLIDKDTDIYSQVSYIRNRINSAKGTKFNPEVVDAFLQIINRKSFWIDLIHGSPDSLFKRILEDSFLDIDDLFNISRIFERIIDFRSSYTATHSIGVANVASILAKLNSMSLMDQKKMRIAGSLHDIGKLSIPNSILEKPSKLTKKEFQLVKTHALHTHSVLDRIREFDDIKEWASYHHEKTNGTGYPFRKGENELSLGSRIMTVSDIFTAILEDRPYRKGMKKNEALRILDSMSVNGEIDGDIVNMLRTNYEEINHIRNTVQDKSIMEFHEFWKEVNQIRDKRLKYVE